MCICMVYVYGVCARGGEGGMSACVEQHVWREVLNTVCHLENHQNTTSVNFGIDFDISAASGDFPST